MYLVLFFVHSHIKDKACRNCKECGAMVGDAMLFLRDIGAAPLSAWNPNIYNNPNCCNFIPNIDDRSGNPNLLHLKSIKALYVSDQYYPKRYKTNIIRKYISKGYPVPFAVRLDETFNCQTESCYSYPPAFNNSYDTWMTFQGMDAGGHSMLIVGYDDIKRAFIVMNSWGKGWNKVNNDPNDDLKRRLLLDFLRYYRGLFNRGFYWQFR